MRKEYTFFEGRIRQLSLRGRSEATGEAILKTGLLRQFASSHSGLATARNDGNLYSDGFTLIEILISAAILSLVILGILGILQFANMTWNSDMGLLDLQQAARQAMDGIIREIRRADPLRNVTMAIDGASIQFYIPDYTDSITYSLSNNQIIREHPNGTNRVLANDISNLSFCWLHTDGSCTASRDCGGLCSKSYLAQVQLRAGKTVKQRQLVFPLAGPLTEQVRLRNE